MDKKILFGTATSRTGGAMLSNILSVHKDILITTDLLHFFRFIYNKYSPIDKFSNQHKLVHEMCLRIKYRRKINLSPKEILSYFKNINNYNDVINALSNFILSKNENKKIFGELANTEWRNIKNFLGFNNNYKAFQIIRDPRAVLSAYKKLTYQKGFKYLNIIFFWIDALNYSEKYLRQYSKDRYFRIKYEDILSYPDKSVKELCQFADVQLDPNMLNADKWPELLKSEFNYLNFSAYDNKKGYGFIKNRIFQWKNHLEEWEVVLVQYLLKDYLKQLDYETIDCNQDLLSKGLEILESDEDLAKNYQHYKKTQEGTDKPLKDPSKPENWGATDTSKNIKAKFVDTNDYKNYLKEIQQIQNQFND